MAAMAQWHLLVFATFVFGASAVKQQNKVNEIPIKVMFNSTVLISSVIRLLFICGTRQFCKGSQWNCLPSLPLFTKSGDDLEKVPLSEDAIAFRNATFKRCAIEENAPADAMIDLYYFRSAEGVKDHKCVTKCIDEAFRIYEKDGTFNKEVIAVAIESLWDEPKVKQELRIASGACVDSLNYSLDPCEVNYDLFECLIKIIKEEGIEVF